MSPDHWPGLTGLLAGAAVLLLRAPRARLPVPASPAARVSPPDWMRRYRPLWSLLAAVGVAVVVGGPVGLVAAAVAAVLTWTGIGRAESPEARRRREAVRRDLPHVVALFATALRSGSDPSLALTVVADAVPGAASDRLREVAARLRLGAAPEQVWLSLADDDSLARLGRAMARAVDGGVPVVRSVERLAEELTRDARAEVEDRARAVGVKAALPLGLCLLPSFVLIGIVPLVGGLLGGLGL